MAEPIEVEEGIVVPADALSWRAVRSGGPGGQNVNKVASKVELRVDLAAITGLTETQRARLLHAAAGRLDGDGRLLVTSSRTRDQPKNLEDARGKVRELVAGALPEPKRRRKTKPTRAAKERRLDSKKRDSEKKRGRTTRW